MEKRVCAKFSRLPNVVGRVDYISNPKRQENLLGFYQTPEDPAQFWRALSEESQDLSAYNKNQIEKHNREEIRKFKAGEIKRKRLWSTVEARENVLCLPNDLYGKLDDGELAKFIAESIKARHGIECAVGVHMNKTCTNYHAHIIMPERKLLEQTRATIATRDTYFDAKGRRSTKKECLENGVLKPGCKVVKKGEKLRERRFSEKDNAIASKSFMYSEKLYFADLFNRLSDDHWVVYNHQTNPHMRLYDLKRGEPEGLRAWKERENATIRQYNATIDEMLEKKDITVAEALQIKQRLYADRADQRQRTNRERELWDKYYESRRAFFEQKHRERELIRCSSSGRKRGTLELVVILGLTIAGVDLFRENADMNEDLVVVPRNMIKAKPSPKLQAMVDELCIAAGRKTPAQILAERKVNAFAAEVKKPSLDEQIFGAEQKKEDPSIEDGNVGPRRDVL